MKLIIDECLAESTKKILKEAGFELLLVEDILKPGIEDEIIFEYGSKKKIPIITHNRGLWKTRYSLPV